MFAEIPHDFPPCYDPYKGALVVNDGDKILKCGGGHQIFHVRIDSDCAVITYLLNILKHHLYDIIQTISTVHEHLAE